MIISIIVAVDTCNAIGQRNKLPWYLPMDLKRFKELTMGHHMLMGRKTWESIGRPLPGRKSIVITRNRQYQPEGCIVVNTLQEGVNYAEQQGETELFIIGGGEIFRSSITLADKIYLSIVQTEVKADTYFQEISSEEWLEINEKYYPADHQHEYAHYFKILIRRR